MSEVEPTPRAPFETVGGQTDRRWAVTDAAAAACESWRAGIPPDDGAYSPASLTGLLLASGLGPVAFAKAIGRGAMTLNRWRRAVPLGRPGRESGGLYRPSDAEWAGIKALMAPKVAK